MAAPGTPGHTARISTNQRQHSRFCTEGRQRPRSNGGCWRHVLQRRTAGQEVTGAIGRWQETRPVGEEGPRYLASACILLRVLFLPQLPRPPLRGGGTFTSTAPLPLTGPEHAPWFMSPPQWGPGSPSCQR